MDQGINDCYKYHYLFLKEAFVGYMIEGDMQLFSGKDWTKWRSHKGELKYDYVKKVDREHVAEAFNRHVVTKNPVKKG